MMNGYLQFGPGWCSGPAAHASKQGEVLLECRVPGMQPQMLLLANEVVRGVERELAGWSGARRQAELQGIQAAFLAARPRACLATARHEASRADLSELVLKWVLLDAKAAPYVRTA